MEGFLKGSKTEGKTMKRSLFVCVAALGLLAGRAPAQDEFSLGFDCPGGEVRGLAGSTAIVQLMATLDSNVATEAGVEGWQISITAQTAPGDADVMPVVRVPDKDGNIAADPADDKKSNEKYMAQGIDIQVLVDNDEDPGTAPDLETMDLGDAGFSNTNRATLPDSDPLESGVVSAIVLTELGSAVAKTLTPVGKTQILRLTIQVTIPAEDSELVVFYKDGFKASGQPVNNVLTYQSGSVAPADGLVLGECRITVGPKDAIFNVAIAPSGQSPAATEDYPPIIVPADAPSIHELDVIISSEELETPVGAEGWQLSLAYDPTACNARMLYYNTDDPGRVIPDDVVDSPASRAKNMSRGFDIVDLIDDDEDPGTPPVEETIDIGDSGFNNTSAASSDYQDSTLPPGLQGLTSAIVLTELGSAAARALRPNVSDVVLKLLIEMPAVGAGEQASCRIYFLDGMKGSGQPVSNVITYQSGSVVPGTMQGIMLTVEGATGPQVGMFKRGDANDDGKFDIADAITIIYDPRVVPGLMGTEIACLYSGDVNDDNMLTLADAVYLITWQFQLTDPAPEPPAPFMDCGEDPTPEDPAVAEANCPKGSVKECPE